MADAKVDAFRVSNITREFEPLFPPVMPPAMQGNLVPNGYVQKQSARCL